MKRVCWYASVTWLLCVVPAIGLAQVRTSGQLVGTVKDSSGAVIPKAALTLIDTTTGQTFETTSGADGGYVFPTLQPGTYVLTATAGGFKPLTLQSIVVQTGRSTDLVVQFQIAGVSEEITVAGRTSVVETTSTTVSNTVTNEQIAKLPLSGRNILDFALLVPGAQQSTGGRDSHFNGLPGAAINITLDGINNNSQRFRSGGTSMFVFAPVRLGAMEEVTVSTSGLAADAGAEGAMQIQFVTRRGSNVLRGQVFDQFRSDKLNANTWVNEIRGVPKTKIKQHEYGANVGGPIIRGRLFFFANFEQVYAPGESTQNRNVLTPEAQQGVFRYVAADGSERTANVLTIARDANFPSTIDPYIAEQLQIVNGTLSRGVSVADTLFRNTFSFIDPNTPNSNVYPTARVDYQHSPSLALRGVLNLQWRDLATRPQFPGLPEVSEGFTSTYYILSTGADWSLSQNLFNQMSFGVQSNYEEFRPGNTLAIYDPQGGRRIPFPLNITSPQITGDQMPIPRNNPVYNLSSSFTYLRGTHSYTFGGTFRRTTMYESIGGAPYQVNLGVAAGDPVSGIFNATSMPGIRNEDLGNVRNLYALLTGRISGVSGQNALDEDTKQYGLNPAFRREAQNVGGLFVQDSWRLTPDLTLNYGLRWEFSGAATNPNEVYSSPTPADLLGPSSAPFQPGVLTGVADPQVLLQPKPYKGDFMNPAPNVGVAWNPGQPEGVLGKIVGRGVYRASFGINYYDEGLINFQTAAGNGPGLTQTQTLNPGMPGFPPGGLNLQSPLPPFAVNPTEFAFPVAQSLFTFSTRNHSTIDPDIRTPYVANWSVGYQREIWRDAAFEIRYVGNRGHNLWRSYDFNEVNIFENGFLDEFRHAQRNLEINVANGRTGFANNNLPGQFALPIFEAAFGPRGSQGALATGSSYTNGTFLTQLQQGQAGAMANTLAGANGTSLYLCRLVGNALPACTALGYNAPGVQPVNFFQANPFAAGNSVRLLTDEAKSKYDALQMQFRQRYHNGISLTANYTYGKARTDRYADSASGVVDYRTLRDKSLNWGPDVYDIRHTFQTYWTYELPIGSGRTVNIDNGVLNQIAGGWAVNGIVRMQTGRPFLLTSGRLMVNQRDAGVVLNGITVEQLQDMVEVRPGPNGAVYVFPEQLIGSDGRANPEFIATPTTPGEFGEFVYLYAPGLWNVDFGFAKQFQVASAKTVNFEILFINAFNHRNTTVGGTGGSTLSITSDTFGQTTGTALGPRNIQLRLQFNW
jgi:hypothetical protein